MKKKVTVKNRTWLTEERPWCPTCGATEMHPEGDKLLIRGYKVSDEKGHWSQCLVCAGYYDADLKEVELDPSMRALTGGWFVDPK